jgi:hypothetical protein
LLLWLWFGLHVSYSLQSQIKKVEEVKNLKIELEGDDADKFKTAIKKIHTEHTRAGFNNTALNPDELKLIKDINDKVNP